ncbi:unnamed protein product [Aphanomyces euteiches]|uniref:Uncharacterized protein n=1 Tax=Aphanomyces euteiches TaxID=100861 RepID=A0A6G0X149_9STRA|nr:hypothetical protein Ae201684_009512 [Aphanomyces euteiches]KAH9085405.1 hypothetical protein Ae201684P_005113 [Aphanomyces euteiches]KAH9155972.1 hypothetical protein AeRB84_002104 [Aphanomyces euteiches]
MELISRTSRVRLEFSDDEDEEDTPRSKKAPSKAAKSGKGREESKSKPKPKYDDISMELSDDDDDDDGDEEEPEIPKTTKAANTKMMKDVDKSNEEKASSEDDETPKPAPVEQKSIASTKPVTSTLNDSSDDTPMQRWTPPPAASTMQTSKPQDQKEESDDDVDEVYSDVEDEISIADDTATEPPPASVQTEQKMEQQKIPAAATKSTNDEGAFNYSMDFSDDLDADNVEASREKSPPSIIQAPRQSTSPPPASTPAAPIVAATKGNDESAASYLDESFMEDEPPPAEPSTAAPLAPESSKDKDEYLEESFAESAEPCPSKPSEGLLARLDNPPLASTHTETSSSQNPTSSQVEPPRAAQPTEVETKLHDDGHLKTPTADIETSRRQHTSSLIVDATPPSEASSAPRTRRNIVIVREYQESRPDKVEMKDASTQYTGNHVQIQADLTPHQDAAIREEPPSTESPERTETQPPPPSMSHSRPSTMDQSSPLPFPNDVNFGTSMASVNTTLATSLYRHQLQQIQAQIRRKRLEADRVMREAMTYRYTSMDAAEKFVAVNRPRKLALWEALMQIDPLMSKEQAMKIEAMSKSA